MAQQHTRPMASHPEINPPQNTDALLKIADLDEAIDALAEMIAARENVASDLVP